VLAVRQLVGEFVQHVMYNALVASCCADLRPSMHRKGSRGSGSGDRRSSSLGKQGSASERSPGIYIAPPEIAADRNSTNLRLAKCKQEAIQKGMELVQVYLNELHALPDSTCLHKATLNA
jgi:hypothetical protein